MNWNKKKVGGFLTALVAIIIVSPLDDVAFAALFGTALFGFSSIAFYLLMAGSSAISVVLWLRRKHSKHIFAKTEMRLPEYWSLA